MGKKNNMEKDGFNLVSNETFAKSTDSWREGNQLFVRHKVATGSPDEVKRILGDIKPGSKSSMPYAHNVKVYEKEEIVPSPNGKIKEKTFVVEETDDLGDGETPVINDPPSTSSFSTSNVSPSELGDDFKKWTKNIIDKCLDTNNLQWVAIISAIAIAALGLGIALVR